MPERLGVPSRPRDTACAVTADTVETMPKITVELTPEELAAVNQYARALGKSTRALAHDLLVAEAQRAAFLRNVDKGIEIGLAAFSDVPEGWR